MAGPGGRPDQPNPETWGVTPEAQAGLAAAEALVSTRIAI